MSNGSCSVCNKTKLLRKDGMVPLHGKCEGGGQEPMPEVSAEDMLLASTYTVEEVKNIVQSRKTGYTTEDLHEMLSNITPKRQKLRERLSARWARFRKNLKDYFDGAWDVFDD